MKRSSRHLTLFGGGGMGEGAPSTSAELPTARLAEALAVIVSEIMSRLPISGRDASLERVTNRFDDLGQTPGGNAAARLLGGVATALMALEV